MNYGPFPPFATPQHNPQPYAQQPGAYSPQPAYGPPAHVPANNGYNRGTAPTPKQTQILIENGYTPQGVAAMTRQQASQIIGQLSKQRAPRDPNAPITANQAETLAKYNYQTAGWTKEQASRVLDQLAQNNWEALPAAAPQVMSFAPQQPQQYAPQPAPGPQQQAPWQGQPQPGYAQPAPQYAPPTYGPPAIPPVAPVASMHHDPAMPTF